jgi:hypothetical protein
LVDATGHSNISVQDYAVAMIDELERPERVRQRFTSRVLKARNYEGNEASRQSTSHNSNLF